MPIVGTVQVTGPIAPTDVTDLYPTHSAVYGFGGHRSVADITARDAISTARREEGMSAWVVSTQELWRLVGGIANGDWELAASGPLDNFGSIFDPTVNDDAFSGYSPGSTWINILTKTVWLMSSNTVGGAVWDMVTPTRGWSVLIRTGRVFPYRFLRDAIVASAALDLIVAAPGTHPIFVSSITVPTQAKLQGSGTDQTFIQFVPAGADRIVLANDASVDGFTITGTAPTSRVIKGSRCSIADIRFTSGGPAATAIDISGGSAGDKAIIKGIILQPQSVAFGKGIFATGNRSVEIHRVGIKPVGGGTVTKLLEFTAGVKVSGSEVVAESSIGTFVTTDNARVSLANCLMRGCSVVAVHLTNSLDEVDIFSSLIENSTADLLIDAALTSKLRTQAVTLDPAKLTIPASADVVLLVTSITGGLKLITTTGSAGVPFELIVDGGVKIAMSQAGNLTIKGDIDHDGANIGFNAVAPVAQGTIVGSRAGVAGLASLLTYLASRGDIIDNTT